VRNANTNQEYSPAPPTRRCGYCGAPLLAQRKGARFCSREHKELARQRRQRAGERLTRLRAAHPFPEDADLRDFSDEFDLDDVERQDDEQGIVAGDSAPDPWQERNDEFAARQEFAAAIDAVNADYARRARPHLERQKRNPGRLLPELAELQRERDWRISELQRAHWKAEAYARAVREQPGRVATAHERQVERAAARSFAMDLGRGRHLRDDPADVGRATSDVFMFGEARPVFNVDNLRNSGVARSLYGHWGDERSQRW